MRSKSEATKSRLKMGTGEGAEYKPYIQVGEIKGMKSTSGKVIDWKTGRVIHLLSQAEIETYFLLRWDDNNVDIREQYPLDIELTTAIAQQLNIEHPHNNKGEAVPMTTDLLLTKKDGSLEAISIKRTYKDLENKRTVEKLLLEKRYWDYKKVPWRLVVFNDYTKEDHQKYINICETAQHYNDELFVNEGSFLKSLIAHKLIKVDMTQPINYEELLKTREYQTWKNKTN